MRWPTVNWYRCGQGAVSLAALYAMSSAAVLSYYHSDFALKRRILAVINADTAPTNRWDRPQVFPWEDYRRGVFSLQGSRGAGKSTMATIRGGKVGGIYVRSCAADFWAAFKLHSGAQRMSPWMQLFLRPLGKELGEICDHQLARLIPEIAATRPLCVYFDDMAEGTETPFFTKTIKSWADDAVASRKDLAIVLVSSPTVITSDQSLLARIRRYKLPDLSLAEIKEFIRFQGLTAPEAEHELQAKFGGRMLHISSALQLLQHSQSLSRAIAVVEADAEESTRDNLGKLEQQFGADKITKSMIAVQKGRPQAIDPTLRAALRAKGILNTDDQFDTPIVKNYVEHKHH